MPEVLKHPCPYRILEDSGGAFSMGCMGGGVFQAIKGFRNAPAGFNRRLYSSLTAVKVRSPIIGGSFAVWGATFSIIECTFLHFRKKDDAWNSIWSGVATGGILAMRKNAFAVVSNAIVGGLLMAIIESISNKLSKQVTEITVEDNSNHTRSFCS